MLLNRRDVEELVLDAVVVAMNGHSGKREQQEQQRVANFARVGGGLHGGVSVAARLAQGQYETTRDANLTGRLRAATLFCHENCRRRQD